MTQFDDDQLAAWLNAGPQHAAPGGLDDALRRAHAGSQRPGWLVAMTGGTLAEDRGSAVVRFAVVAAAVAVLTTLMLGALVAGGIIKPFPVPSIVAIQSGSPEPSSTVGPLSTPLPATGVVAYTQTNHLDPGEGACQTGLPGGCTNTRAMVAQADGSNAHELLPDADPMYDQRVDAWLPDGSRLLVEINGVPKLVSLSGKAEPLTDQSLCDYPCVPELMIGPAAFSPDGQRFAYTRQYPDTTNGTVITILNLRTGQIRQLSSTYATNPPGFQCNKVTTCEGWADAPAWSPDGKQLVFNRQHMSPDGDSQWTSAAVFVVDADGNNLRRITPPGFFAIDPSWSPDGSRITFVNAPFKTINDGKTADLQSIDVYTVRPDGSDLQQLTTDGDSGRPDWTTAGRIVFARNLNSDSPTLWIMDADGSHQARILGNVLAEEWAAGCITCMFPLDAQPGGPVDALWQP
ncbi:MAG TPA: hypothetical protein VF153_05125 [Candidatus Limnocylindria bacterium]